MSDATMEHHTDSPDDELDPLSVVLRAADSLVSSPEPEVVFESLVRLCAPLVCDAATATVSTADGRIHAATWPYGELPHWSQSGSIVTEFDAPAAGGRAGYHGLVSFRFRLTDERQPLVVQLLVERAMANVERARMVEEAASWRATVDHLHVALSSNREIGVAVGIVMVNHQLTRDQAFDLLSRVSQHVNRKLGAVALEVAQTGGLDLPDGVAIVKPGGRRARRRLSSVPTLAGD